MTDTTSIFDLPVGPTGGSSGDTNNITINAIESNPQNNQLQQNTPNQQFTLDQSTINQIVTGLQQASTTGVTLLQSRDIPQNTNSITQDPHIQPNYIPERNENNYIETYTTNEDIINKYNKTKINDNSLDEMYNEIQMPLLLSVLFFLFQLPFFRKFLFNYFPILFSKDGNYNLNGFLFTSVLFGIVFYLLNKLTSIFNKF